MVIDGSVKLAYHNEPKNKIKLAITGCMGRMGREIIRSSKKDKAFKLAVLTENKIINKQIEKMKKNVIFIAE